VEILGDEAVFLYNEGEECTLNDEEQLVCEENTYFQEYESCK